MSIKPDHWIEKMALEQGMIEPFIKESIKPGFSAGLSSYGYDMRLGNKFRILKTGSGTLDPKNSGPDLFEDFEGEVCVIPPHSFVLGQSVEYFRIPRNILAIAFGKSSYARSGVTVNLTPFEPEWEGFVTLQIANNSPYSVKIYAGEGIAQVLFLEASQPCQVSYADKKGRYQAQKKITHSRA